MNSESQPESVSLSPEEIAYMGEFLKAVEDINRQANAALGLIIRQKHLKGNWTLDGDKLVRRG